MCSGYKCRCQCLFVRWAFRWIFFHVCAYDKLHDPERLTAYKRWKQTAAQQQPEKSPNVAREKCKNVMIIIKSLSYPTHKYVTGYGSASKAKPNYKYAYGMVRVGNWGANPESVWHYKTHNLQHIVGRGKIENENQIKNTHKHYANGVRNERERKKFHHIFFLLLGFAGCFLYLFPHRFTVKRRKKNEYAKQQPATPFSAKINKWIKKTCFFTSITHGDIFECGAFTHKTFIHRVTTTTELSNSNEFVVLQGNS